MRMNEPFERAVEQHGATVLRVCRAMLGPTADADDAWQETFLGALRAWPDLDSTANVEAWLVRIAQRKCFDAHRARGRSPIPVEELSQPRRSHQAQHATEFPHYDDELWGAVAALPLRQREALAYHYLGGLKHTETAELTGSTPAAVRRAAADGLARLRADYVLQHDTTQEDPK